MRRTLTDQSESDLLELAAEWGITLKDSEVSELCERVNDRLDGLDDVYEIRLSQLGTPGERTWSEPTEEDDPYNALAIRCQVSPTEDGPLTDTSVGLKDNIAVAGIPMQCGSAVMEGFVPTEDATVVERLQTAGATITAKTNLDEFAGGGRGLAVDGSILHPIDTDHFPGGSSGGSAAAVLADQVDIALGTDTGGSVRVPAALCGLVGVKPTYGLVPLSGVMENTYSLDHVGTITETLAEAARCLESLAGKDQRDPASMAAAGQDDYSVGGYVEAVAEPKSVEELVLGRVEPAFAGTNDRVAEGIDTVLERYADRGATVVDVSIPGFDLVDTLKDCLTCPELAQYWRDGGVPLRRGGGGESRDHVGFARRGRAANGELNLFYRGRMLTGAILLTQADGRHYSRALAARRELRETVVSVMEDAGADALVSPTVPGIAPRHEDAEDPGFGITANTRIANITEQPALSIPVGTVDDLPIGLHLLGRRFSERSLFRTAAALEAEG